MKVLILSCNTGGGHNSAGRAIREEFTAVGVPCDLVNLLSFTSRSREQFICKGHVFAYRNLPQLYGAGYRYVETHSPEKPVVRRSNVPFFQRLFQYITLNSYDTVICVHIFAALAVSTVMEQHPDLLHGYFVATDYTCSPGAADAELDAYYIPHARLIEEFVGHGMSREKVVVSGIPVQKNFLLQKSRQQARRELKLPEDGRMVLLMCGSMGCGPMRQLTESCMAELPADCLLVTVCGNNKRLESELNEIKSSRLRVVGFTDQVADYMDAADIILTKGGGLSATEAAICKRPILFVEAVPGCESRNVDFFVQNGYAAAAQSTDALVELLCDYLSDMQKMKQQVGLLTTDFPQNAAQTICMDVMRRAGMA